MGDKGYKRDDQKDSESSRNNSENDSSKERDKKNPDDKKVDKERHMAFTDHLEELRRRLFKIIGTVVVLGFVSYFFAENILAVLTRPLPEGQVLQYLRPTGGFLIYIKVSFFSSLLLSMPVIIYQFWQFVAPGLFPKEKKYVLPVILFTIICFAIGATFSYLVVIPLGLQFLQAFQTEFMVPNWTIDEFISFVTMLMLVFGLVFELPLVALFLGRIGIINSKMMSKYRRHALFGAIVFGAILTPPDFITQLALAIPLWILYEISIILVRFLGSKPSEDDI